MPVRRKRKEPPRDDELVRLNKRLSELGYCSRREADDFIKRGQVKVDGKVVSELGTKVARTQFVELDRDAARTQAGKITVLLHKPTGFVSGQAEHGHRPAVELLKPRNFEGRYGDSPYYDNEFPRGWKKGLAPAGRLDHDSTGLLVLTADGVVAKTLIGPDSDVEKEYVVGFDGLATPEDLDMLRHGLFLDGRKLAPARVEREGSHRLRIVLREGRRRQIRRMLKMRGLEVTFLHRVRIGKIHLASLQKSKFRFLRDGEAF